MNKIKKLKYEFGIIQILEHKITNIKYKVAKVIDNWLIGFLMKYLQ